MILDKIKNNAKLIVPTSRWNRGYDYYIENNVEEIENYLEQIYLCIEAEVKGAWYNDYKCAMAINLENLQIEHSKCTCEDFRENSRYSPQTYLCKHIVSSLYKAMEEIDKTNKEDLLEKIHEDIIIANKIDPQEAILGSLEKEQEKIKLEVHMENLGDETSSKVEFKIGKDKMYVMKSPKDFAHARFYNKEIKYGKDFTYNPKKHYFSQQDEEIASMIDEMVEINKQLAVVPKYKREIELVQGKSLNIIDKSMKRFFNTIGDKTIKFKIDNIVYDSKVLKKDLPISFNIEKKENELILTSDENMPKSLSSKGDVFFYDGNIYLPSPKQYDSYRHFYKFLKEENIIRFDKKNIKEVVSKVIPKLDEISTCLNIDESIESKIKKDLSVKFYLDRKKDLPLIKLEFIYGDVKSNKSQEEEHYIIRDRRKENNIKDLLEKIKFEEQKENEFLFNGDDSDFYAFLSEEIKNLQNLGEVYYSDRFKYKVQTPSVSASINKDKDNNFLQINFDIENVDEKEYKNILKSFKDNRRFHKLKNDVILDLKNEQAQELFTLLDNISSDISKDIKNKSLKINNNKAIYINEIMNKDNLNFIHGREHVKSISDKIKTINTIDEEVPEELNATLREYQVEGYKWFKTLNHLGFSGILADEMGLGKTIQTISFLIADKNKKTLIVTPTSLIYNWKDEFENFAPNTKVLIMHGDKNQREELFKTIDEYDVILTTYATLRNDSDFYEDKYFDYFIIDEAQNIKNPFAQNTEAVKNIKANNRFALTGTPIENNLVELWSIFDFLMPGYLFTKKSFENKFVKGKSENLLELKKMINPFVLRRLKKDVLEELPEKIEKKFFVEMTKEQKTAYTALVNDINEKRNDKEFKSDKITIFSYLTKLRQLCLDPSILIQGYSGGSSKIDICLDLIKENIEENHKILLFSQFTSVLKNLGQVLADSNITYSYIDGSVSASKRVNLVNEFNEGDKNKVFLISLKAGGTGLNLTSADVVIHFDPWWNPAIEDQATDRAHRFGQKNVVEVIKLIAKGTVEEKIIKMQDDKKELISNIMSGEMNNSGLLSTLSESDINELFTY
ncbi:MAG: DEAD/DEAH box helicase [Terrisporobacter sp.]